MNKISLLFLSSLALLGCSQEPPIDTTKKHAVILNLTNINPTGGDVYASIYQKGELKKTTKQLTIKEAMNTIHFNNIEEGKYALFIYQDNDSDGLLSMDGYRPLEPLGYSNNPTLQGPANFDDISVLINKDTTQNIALIHY